MKNKLFGIIGIIAAIAFISIGCAEDPSVDQPDYGIRLTDSKGASIKDVYHLPALEIGYTGPDADNVKLTVNVNNRGKFPTGALTIDLSGTGSANFKISASSISNIEPGESESFTITPETGLAEGTYTAKVTVSGDYDINASFNVSFTVNGPAPKWGIILNPSEDYVFPIVFEGYTLPTHTVTITNQGNQPTGALTVSLSGIVSGNFIISKTSIGNIAEGSSDDFTVQPKLGLAPGTYTAKVTVLGGHGINASFNIGLNVNAVPTWGISLNPSADYTFTSASQGYTPQTHSVTITNNGNQPTGTLTVALSGTDSNNFTVSKTSVSDIADGSSDDFTVQPKAGLLGGTYTATVTVSGGNGISASFNVKFGVKISSAIWGYNSIAVVGSKVVMGPGEYTTRNSILIVDTVTNSVSEIGTISSAFWGYRSTVVVGNKVVMGPGLTSNGFTTPKNSILIVDTDTNSVSEISTTSFTDWGYNRIAVAGNKVVMLSSGLIGNSILIVDTTTNTASEISTSSSVNWGIGSICAVVVGNKVVIGCVFGNPILIVDTATNRVSEIKTTSSAHWGNYNSIAVVGNKVVMGGDLGVTSILIVDTVAETVSEIGKIPFANWGYNSTVVVGNKVVMGSGSHVTSILIVDTATNRVSEIKTTSSASWGYTNTVVAGNKVVMGPGGKTGNSILIVDTAANSLSEISTHSSAEWGWDNSITAVGSKVVMGPGNTGNSILIVDTTTDTASEISTSYRVEWGVANGTVAIGSNVVMGCIRSVSRILIIDTVTDSLSEISTTSSAHWGEESTVITGDKVVMGPGYIGGKNSILIIDPAANRVMEKDGTN